MVLLRFEWHKPVSWQLKLPPPPGGDPEGRSDNGSYCERKAASPKSTSTANDFVQLIDINSNEDVHTTAIRKRTVRRPTKTTTAAKIKIQNRDQQIVKNGKQKHVENEVQSEQAARAATRGNVEGSRSNTAQKEANNSTRKKSFLKVIPSSTESEKKAFPRNLTSEYEDVQVILQRIWLNMLNQSLESSLVRFFFTLEGTTSLMQLIQRNRCIKPLII